MDKKVSRRVELVESKSRKLRSKGKREVNADINVTPLVDVVLVLLIIFMVVTPLLGGFELPEAIDPQGVQDTADDLNIYIKSTGEILVEDKPVTSDNLAEALAVALRKNPLRPVYLSADKELAFKKIRSLLIQFRNAGVSQAGLMSKPLREE